MFSVVSAVLLRPSPFPNADRIVRVSGTNPAKGWRGTPVSDETELHLAVCHFPPGSSKWNKIEQRFFSAITQNWRGKPLVNHEVIINLISATTTNNGLRVESQLDTNLYPKGINISDKQMAEVQLRREEFHGDWNYSILPRSLQAGNVIP